MAEYDREEQRQNKKSDGGMHPVDHREENQVADLLSNLAMDHPIG